ncbi:hypothetical protein [Singulisphaera sp. PoT]|uniref:hypothetical protein n=1 Tax=Singulisphaera sp. PoT TaxID=3411797 RepID=UPI003BF48F18
MPVSRIFGEGELSTVTRPAPQAISAQGFMACPVPMQGQFAMTGWMQEVYRLAYERAQACVQAPWHESHLFTCMN